MLPHPTSEPMVGRQREMEVARRLLTSAAEGVPQLLVVSGEPGIGKTQLARTLAAVAASQGARTLWGAGQEDLSLPYLPLTMALGPLLDEGSGPLGPAVTASDLSTDPAARWAEIADTLLDAAAQAPLVLVVDDLQWTDPASQALLLHLQMVLNHAAITRPVRLLTVVTVRSPTTDERVARTLSRLAREPNAVSLELAGLDRTEMRDLLATIGPAPASAGLLQQIMESTSGSPLLARSIVARGVREGRLTISRGTLAPEAIDPLRARQDELDRSTIDSLEKVSARCRDLLAVAAFLGDQCATSEVALIAGMPQDDADALIEEAIEAGLLHDMGARCAFATSQVRHVLFHAPPRRARQRLHLRIADALEERGEEADALAIAHHLARAGDLAPKARVARWATVAAHQAMQLGAWADAGIAATQALAALAEDAPWEARADLHLLLTDAASHDFDLPTAHAHGIAVAELARGEGDSGRWGLAVLRLARTLVTNAGDTSVTTSSNQLIHEFLEQNPGADAALRAELLALHSEICGAANRSDEALHAAVSARALLEDGTPPQVAAAVFVAEGLARWSRLDVPEATAAYDQALRASGSPLPTSAPGVYAAVRRTLVDHLAGEVDRATASARGLLTELAARQMWGEHGLIAAGATNLALVGGRFDDVEQLAATTELSVSRSAYLDPLPVSLPALALARALRGDGTGARRAIERLGAGPGTTARYGLAIDAVLGDADRVRGALANRTWRPPTDVPSLRELPGAVLYGEVAVAVADPSMAAAALDPLRSAHARGVVQSLGWCVLLSRLISELLLVAGESADAGEWLATATTEAGDRGLIVEQARVALTAARAAAALDSPDATARASSGAHALDDLGLLPLAASARRLAQPAGDDAGPARRAILFTDLADSTDLNVRAGDAAYLDLMREHNEVIRQCLHQHGGVEFKHTGDGIAAWFAAPGDAVRCAVSIGRDLERASVLHPEMPLRVRSGISIGEPLGHEGDLFGLTVVHASRLCELAATGEVLVSDEIAAAVRSRGVALRSRGRHRLKGFPAPVEVHAVDVHASVVGDRSVSLR